MFQHTPKTSGLLKNIAKVMLVVFVVSDLIVFPIDTAVAATSLLVNNESFNTIDTGDGATSRELRFGSSSFTFLYSVANSRFEISRSLQVGGTLTATGSVIAKSILSGTTLRVSGNADVQGGLTASGAARFDANLTLNDDLGASDVTLTFGNSVSNGVLTYSNTFREFNFDHGIRTAGSISGSGNLVFEGSASGASLYLGTSLNGAGLVSCSTNATDKLLWNSSTGRFSCGTDQTGASSGLTQAAADARYVGLAGGTMTGALNLQNGTTGIPSTTTVLNARGTMSGRSLFISGTGSTVQLKTEVTTGNTGIGTSAPKSKLDVVGTISGSILRAARQIFSSGSLSVEGNSYLDDSFYVDGTNNKVSVGVGRQNITPKAALEVGGTVSGSLVTQNGGGDNYYLGNIGVGKTTTTSKLDVVGTVSGSTLRVSGNTTIHGTLTASGAARFDNDLTLNDDLGANDVNLTFGNSVSSGIVTYSNVFREFYFDHGIRTAGSISGSGNLVFEGAASGASLYLGTSLKGAGLSTCSNATNDKLLWDSATGRFSCGTDQTGAAGGLTQAGADARYVSKAGSTMTGALNLQNGTSGIPATATLLNVRGTMSGRTIQITGTGSKPLLFSDVTKGYFGIGTNTPTAQLTLSGGTFLQIAGGTPTTASGIDLGVNVNQVFVSGNYAYVATDVNANATEVRTVDISNPNAPSIFGAYETSQSVSTLFVSTKHMFVGLSGANAGSGLLILDNSNPGRQVLVSRMNFGTSVKSIYVSGKYIFVGLASTIATQCSTKSQLFTGCDFVVIDFTNVNAPSIIAGIKFSTDVNALYVQNRYAFVGLASVAGNDFRIIDLQNPYNPSTAGGIDYTNTVNSIYISGKYAFVGVTTDAGNPEFRVVDIGDKSNARNVGSLETGITVKSIVAYGDWARIGLASGAGDDYWTVDLRNPLVPKKVGGIDFGADVNSVYVAGKYAYAGLSSVAGNDMRILDLDGIESPVASIGSISAANLIVSDNARFDNNLYVRNALNVGRGGIISKGPLSVQSVGTGTVMAGTGVVATAFEVRNSTGQTLLSVTDDGQVSGGIPSFSTGSTLLAVSQMSRRSGWLYLLTTAAVIFTAVGMTLPSGGAGVVISADAQGNRMYLKYAATNTSAALGGISGTYTETRPNYRPKMGFWVKTATGTTNLRFWGGLTESTLTSVAPSLTSAASGVDYVAMAWEDTVNGLQWMCCSGDGTNHTCVGMGAPVTINTEYVGTVDFSQQGKLICRLQAGAKTYTTIKTSNITTTNTTLGVHLGITNKATAVSSHVIYLGRVYLEQN